MIKIILITLIIFHAETRKAYELWKARLQHALQQAHHDLLPIAYTSICANMLR